MTTTSSVPRTGDVGGAIETAATVYLEALSLYYGTYRAVKDINLVLQPQAITAMIGHKGPYLLEVFTGKENNVFPMVPQGCSVSEIRLK